jgi:carbamoyltransferase
LKESIHHDGTSRIQTVANKQCPLFTSVLMEIKKIIGFGSVLNTSFNLAGEPIVETPVDALRTFISSGLDDLVIGNYHVKKYV